MSRVVVYLVKHNYQIAITGNKKALVAKNDAVFAKVAKAA